MKRRHFLQLSAVAGLFSATGESLWAWKAVAETPEYTIEHLVPAKMYDGKQCWVHPRAGIVPGAGRNGQPRIVMTMNTLDVSGSDVFKGLYSFQTDDLGKTWSEPVSSEQLAVRYQTIEGQERPVAVSDFWPAWHAASQTLLGTGHTVVYTPEWRVSHQRPRHTSWSIYNPESSLWSDWQTLEMPDPVKFHNAGAGCVQRFDEPDGSILLPIYFSPPGKKSQVTVARCHFDGRELKFVEQGNELSLENKTRGLHEPSLTRFNGQYYLTIRNDELGFVTRSSDGLNYSPLQPWRFDDGSELGNYNTQQHWVTHPQGLFLVYTRRGANNDHVARHRAPLFMAQVDPERMCVIRDTEQVLVPERGARLGNFGVTAVSPQETWVTVSEWMQTWGPNYILPVDNKYGSDGSVWVARILWK